MKRLLKIAKYLAGALVVAFLIAMALWPKPLEVDLGQITRGPLTITIDEEGRTRVRERFVVSAPVAGRVGRITLEPGAPVVRNRTVVAVFTPADPLPLDARSLAEAEAAVRAAEAKQGRAGAERDRTAAAVRLAQSELERLRALFTGDLISRHEYEPAENRARAVEDEMLAADYSVAVADHELESARARLLSISSGPGDAARAITLRSPVTGVVLERLRESEAVVPAGEPLLELGDPRNLEIITDFLSTDAVRIRPGYPVRIERWGGERSLNGRVRRVEPAGFMKLSALGVEEQRVSVIIDLEDPAEAWERLGDDYRVEVRVIIREDDSVLKAPTGSLFRHGEDWAVFVVEEDRAVLRKVAIGQRNSREAHILEGLQEGDSVILHPSDSVMDGSRLKIRIP